VSEQLVFLFLFFVLVGLYVFKGLIIIRPGELVQ